MVNRIYTATVHAKTLKYISNKQLDAKKSCVRHL